MDVSRIVTKILRFHDQNKRLPRQGATTANERKLAQWLAYMKRRARGVTGKLPLSPTDLSELARIPGWDPQRWVRNKLTTGIRRGKHGWEAQIQVKGSRYYGPSRSTSQQARADYLELRAAADANWDTFASTFSVLRPDRSLLQE